jgi:hypothetical protein
MRNATLARRDGVSGDRNEPSYRPLQRGLLDRCATGPRADYNAADEPARDDSADHPANHNAVNAEHAVNTGVDDDAGDIDDTGDTAHDHAQ